MWKLSTSNSWPIPSPCRRIGGSVSDLEINEVKTRDILIIGGVAAVALWYLKKQAISATNAVLNAPGAVGESIANAIYDWVNPNNILTEF